MASIYSVTQVNSYIKNMFAQDFVLNKISVRGEVSNCKYHSSGHVYFTLKDEGGTLSAVMFASRRSGLNFVLKDGMQVVVNGSIEVYEKTGSYQIYAQKIEQAGLGDLYERFVKLKEKLEDMGMFAQEYKQPIPKFAHTIGIVTAPTGAAIRDIINITSRRNPYVQLVLCPALVQGDGAAESIVRAIKRLDAYGTDVMIVGRGGGSLEDLWAFNEEIVARAVFEAKTPIISAVGHETDFTITDYVSDLRAPTPSAAAELATIDIGEFEEDLEMLRDRLTGAMQGNVEALRNRAERYTMRLSILSPAHKLNEIKMRETQTQDRLRRIMSDMIIRRRNELSLKAEKLKGLSPLSKIASGYAWVSDKEGNHVKDVNAINTGDTISVKFKSGTVDALVTEVRNG